MAGFKAMLLLSLTLATFVVLAQSTANNIGAAYGLNGDNLPSPIEVVNLYKQLGIQKMRIFEPNPEVLRALRGSGISLTLGVRNQDIPHLAAGEESAGSWFAAHVLPYIKDVDIEYITVGNEVIPGEYSELILPAMGNLQGILQVTSPGIKATTVVHSAVLGNSYPPSAGEFSDSSRPFMSGIVKYLSSQKTPLLVNIYPYFAYASDPDHISLDYALLSTTNTVVSDGSLGYTNLLDAMVDPFYSAIEKEGVTDVNLIISETGWPHGGSRSITTPQLAATYNRNFLNLVKGLHGTPKRPNIPLEGYFFDIIDENLKAPGVEQNWGLFNPSMQPNYNLFG